MRQVSAKNPDGQRPILEQFALPVDSHRRSGVSWRFVASCRWAWSVRFYSPDGALVPRFFVPYRNGRIIPRQMARRGYRRCFRWWRLTAAPDRTEDPGRITGGRDPGQRVARFPPGLLPGRVPATRDARAMV